MLDPIARRLINPPLDYVGRKLARRGIGADHVTIMGFLIGIGAPLALSQQSYGVALACILVNRLFDGLDGAVARAGRPTDLGGFLDIVLDFLFYALIPLGFALADGGRALAASFLLASFMGTSASFLAFAVFAAKHGLSTDLRGNKALYYLGGLTEGTETIAFFILCCLFPDNFSILAIVFGSMCWVTTASRIWWGTQILKSRV